MSTAGKVLLVGCLLVMVLGFGGCMVLVGWLIDDPDQVEVSVEAPIEVLHGEAFEIVARVHNRAGETQELTSLEVGVAYAAGIAVQSSRPPFVESRSRRPGGDVLFSYGLELAPGGEEVVVLEAVAAHPGDYAAEIEFCINDSVHCLSQVVRTVVVVPRDDGGAALPAERPAALPPELP